MKGVFACKAAKMLKRVRKNIADETPTWPTAYTQVYILLPWASGTLSQWFFAGTAPIHALFCFFCCAMMGLPYEILPKDSTKTSERNLVSN